MPVKVELIRRLSDGVIVLSYGGDRAIWTRRKLRKDAPCACGAKGLNKMKAGTMAYGPIGNQRYRIKRIHAAHFENATVTKDDASRIERLTFTKDDVSLIFGVPEDSL